MSTRDIRHTDDPSSLGPNQRATSLATLRATTPEKPLDLLVVGGGVVGCGAALDAAVRGLSVGLVEAGDLASRDIEPILAPGPRRPALPRAA